MMRQAEFFSVTVTQLHDMQRDGPPGLQSYIEFHIA